MKLVSHKLTTHDLERKVVSMTIEIPQYESFDEVVQAYGVVEATRLINQIRKSNHTMAARSMYRQFRERGMSHRKAVNKVKRLMKEYE